MRGLKDTINPFDITFGKVPNKVIERPEIVNNIIDNLSDFEKGCHLYLLAGPRGSGKTVSLSSIIDFLKPNTIGLSLI